MTGRPGTGRLVTIVRRQAGSVVGGAYAASPLKLLTPSNHGHAAWVYTVYVRRRPGRWRFAPTDIDVGAGRERLRLDPGVDQGVPLAARTSVRISRRAVASGGLLVWCARSGRVLCRRTLRAGSARRAGGRRGLVLVDWMTSGRRGSGERWCFEHYANGSLVRCDRRSGAT